MIWSICWISRRTHLLVVPMISSTIQRLSRRTCGLFDSGFAGDEDFITSSGLNAPDDALSNFGLDGHISKLNPGISGMNNSEEGKKVNSWNVLDELDDLSGDPLGDDSMEAFVNLDKFLNGNSFFDEDGNLTVPDEKEAEVMPVINFAPQTEDLMSDPMEINNSTTGAVQNFHLPTPNIKSEKPSRKRTAKGGIKTSLYEIPAVSVIPEIIQDGSYPVTIDTEHDHDYSSKRQKMSPITENKSSTSGAMKELTQGNEDTETPSTSAFNDSELLNDTLDKQTIRRIKNNHASKRSREQRKQKFVEMDHEAEDLIVRNQELREKIVSLEKLAKEMKEVLVAKMAGK